MAQDVARPSSSRTLSASQVFVLGLGAVYAVLSLAVMGLIEREWVANWDVQTFLTASRTFTDGGSPFDLYAVSRATSPWPYAYPPLFALVTAPFVGLADVITGEATLGLLPLVMLRVPIVLADVGVAALLYAIIREQTRLEWLGRVGAILWLFSPILFYHTAIQAHLESLWLLPTLAAYGLLQQRRGPVWGPMVLLALAICVKQTAFLYAIPYGLLLLKERRWRDIALFSAISVGMFGLLVLPFALYSDDFRYMLLDYVAQMPVQVQSWQVWTLALDAYRLEQTRTTFPTVQYALYFTVAVNLVVSAVAVWQGRSWFTIGLAVTLAFLLTAHKAIGYHYPILLIWLIAYALPIRNFPLLMQGMLLATWIVVSPYFAPWANVNSLPFYALLGTVNSLIFALWLYRILRGEDAIPVNTQVGDLQGATDLLRWQSVMTISFLLAPTLNPIRVLIQERIPDSQLTLQLAALLGLMLALVALTIGLIRPVTRRLGEWAGVPEAAQRQISLQWTHATTALVFGVLFFTWFTMNAEVTAVLEKGLWQAWGLS